MPEPLGSREIGTALIAHPGAELYGSDRVMLETLAGLLERRWRVVLTVPNDGPLLAAARLLGAETTVLQVPVLRKRSKTPSGLAAFLARSVSAARRIDRLIDRVRPDVVYVSTTTLPLWVARGRAKHVPVVVHVHENEREQPLLVREAVAWPLRLADRLLVDSESGLAALTEVLPALKERSLVVRNGIPAPPALRLPRAELQGGLRIAYVGRLSPRKGVDVAVAALGLLVDSGIEAHLDLVGSVFPGYEWYERSLHEQAATLGIQDRVTFHGFRAAVWDTLENADVAVVPSRLEEPFGNTAVEAVLAARPVVVSATGGLAEAIDGFASAIPIEADDPAELAAALHRIAASWPEFGRRAVALAPAAARRYSPEIYRATVAAEIARIAHIPAPAPALAS